MNRYFTIFYAGETDDGKKSVGTCNDWTLDGSYINQRLVVGDIIDRNAKNGINLRGVILTNIIELSVKDFADFNK